MREIPQAVNRFAPATLAAVIQAAALLEGFEVRRDFGSLAGLSGHAVVLHTVPYTTNSIKSY